MFVPTMGEFDVRFVLRIPASPWHSLKFSSEGVCFRHLPNLYWSPKDSQREKKKILHTFCNNFGSHDQISLAAPPFLR